MERLSDVQKAAYKSELRKTVRTPEQEPTPKDRQEGRRKHPPPALLAQSFKLSKKTQQEPETELTGKEVQQGFSCQ